MKAKKQKLTRAEKSWAFYDWANSAFTLIIITTIMPVYFKAATKTAGISDTTSTAYLGYATSIGTLLLAISAPVLGALAAYYGLKKKLFSYFVYSGVIFTMGLALIPSDNWLLLISLYVIAFLAYEGSIIFYDAFIVDVTTDQRMDMLSAKGFSLGYFGSIIPFIICMAMIMLVDDKHTVTATKASFIITGLWWAIFSIPIIKNVEQKYGILREKQIVTNSFKRLGQTLKSIMRNRNILLFLIAFFFYIDGVNTVISMASSFAIDIGMKTDMLLVLIFIIQIVAIPFALLYGKLSEKFGAKKIIYLGIITYLFICTFAYFVENTTGIWIIACLIGTAQGGLQALSRSFFGKIIPKERANEYYGFYSIFGKFAAIIGPALMGFVTAITDSTQKGVLSLVILFLIGAIVFYFVKDQPATSSQTNN